jgi:hypothetical protein
MTFTLTPHPLFNLKALLMDISLTEIKQKFNDKFVTSLGSAVQMKLKEQIEIDALKQDFFKRGGEIQVFGVTVSTMPVATAVTPQMVVKRRIASNSIKDLGSMLPFHSNTKPLNPLLNITKIELVSRNSWVVSIAGVSYGSFDSEELAIKFRDNKRRELKMSMAPHKQ